MSMLRFPLSLGFGTLFSIALFWGLRNLINEEFRLDHTIAVPVIRFTPQLKDTVVEPERPEPPTYQPPIAVLEIPRIGVSTDTREELPRYDRPQFVGLELIPPRTLVSGTDRDATPRIRVNPIYPPAAEQRGIEGWVRVQFTITATGSVKDVTVVAAEPDQTFNRAAIEAVARWRYDPRVDHGVAVDRVGVQTVIRFDLD